VNHISNSSVSLKEKTFFLVGLIKKKKKKKNLPSKNSLARLLTNTDPAKMQSGGAISSMVRGEVPLTA